MKELIVLEQIVNPNGRSDSKWYRNLFLNPESIESVGRWHVNRKGESRVVTNSGTVYIINEFPENILSQIENYQNQLNR